MRHARGIRLLAIAALVAICCTGTALAARSSSSHVAAGSKLAGKWKGQYGGAVSGHFTLHWTQTGTVLSGKITLSNPKGTYDLSGKVKNRTKIKFGAVGVGATYKGTWKGSKMSGTWNSPRGGGSWSAHKVS
ncbi:MAG TPA: hypothetical protein VJP41_00055 [Gaiellaceae bacterium]|nr:hypothetical protein [Gaiellaceae bacterium]